MANNASNVQAGKPKIGGAIFVADKGTTIPTDCTSALAAAFKCMGYVSDDGVDNDNSPETDSKKAWGGDPILTTQTGKPDQFKFTLVECTNLDVLKFVYGSSNVSGTLETGVTIKATSDEAEEKVIVIDTLLGGVAKRIVIPKGKLSSVGTITYKDDEAVGYELTVDALSDGIATHYEYMKTV